MKIFIVYNEVLLCTCAAEWTHPYICASMSAHKKSAHVCTLHMYDAYYRHTQTHEHGVRAKQSVRRKVAAVSTEHITAIAKK